MRAASVRWVGFTWPRFVGLVLASCVILFLRRPEALLAPEFFAEDGAVFFRDAYEWPFWRSLWRPHSGYPELFPRLVAACVATQSPAIAPLLYALVALATAGISLSWIWLPHFRHLIRSDAARLFLVFLLLLAPNQEALMKLSCAQGYLLVWAGLTAFMRMPVPSKPYGRVARIAIVAGCAVVFASSPLSLLLVPVWLARLWTGRPGPDRVVAAFRAPEGVDVGVVASDGQILRMPVDAISVAEVPKVAFQSPACHALCANMPLCWSATIAHSGTSASKISFTVDPRRP